MASISPVFGFMAITTPLTLKSTKGMLEMQKVAPEMRRLQNEYFGIINGQAPDRHRWLTYVQVPAPR